MLDLVLQQFANGLSSGMTYALLALGLTLVFGVLHVVNFAHGEFYMVGGLVCAVMTNLLGVPYLLTLPLAVLATAAVAWLVDAVAVRPVLAKPGGGDIVLVATFAAGVIVQQAVLASIGPAPIRAAGFEGAVHLGPVAVTYQRLFVFVAGAVMIAALEIILNGTRFGQSLRAVAQSGYAAQVVGLNVARIRSWTFLLAAAFAGLAGALIVPIVTFNAGMGQSGVITAFVIVVDAGEVVALVGSNGAGKSSTLKAILGLQRATGRISLDGEDLSGASSMVRVERGVALSPEGRHVFPQMSVRENLELGAIPRTRADMAALTEEMLGLFPRLRERFDQLAGSMSGGEQQMLAIARALMSRPKVLLLDEPTLGLAPIIVDRIADLALALKAKGLGVLLAEQNAEMALGVADRAYVMENGRVAKQGRAREIATDKAVMEAYLGFSEDAA
jgi:ABC-type branched-subunit amino acid transport system ATPase component